MFYLMSVLSVRVWFTGVRGGGRWGWGGGVWAGAAGAETRRHGMRLHPSGLLHWDRNRDVLFSLSWLTWFWIICEHLGSYLWFSVVSWQSWADRWRPAVVSPALSSSPEPAPHGIYPQRLWLPLESTRSTFSQIYHTSLQHDIRCTLYHNQSRESRPIRVAWMLKQRCNKCKWIKAVGKYPKNPSN